MNKLAKLAMWSLGALLVLASPVFAQDGGQALIEFSGAFGADRGPAPTHGEGERA